MSLLFEHIGLTLPFPNQQLAQTFNIEQKKEIRAQDSTLLSSQEKDMVVRIIPEQPKPIQSPVGFIAMVEILWSEILDVILYYITIQ